MKITFITEYFPESSKLEIRGGVESRCFYLGKELAKRHQVTVITSWTNGAKREETIEGMRVLRVGPDHAYTHKGAISSRLLFAQAAEEMASKIPADIIEGTNFISYLPAFNASRKQDVPAIATYHEVWIGSWIKTKGFLTGSLGSLWERIVLTKPWDKIIAVSEFTKNALTDQGIPSRDIDIIPNGVDIAQYLSNKTTDERKKTKKEKETKNIEKITKTLFPSVCCVCRLTPQKRVEDLIKAFAMVQQRFKNAQCFIIGVGDEEEHLKKIANELHLSSAIKFLGFVKDHQDVIKYIQQSTLFCLPSVMEGFGIVILEAMASGTPYVCTDIPPLKEITNNGQGGLLAQQKNPQDLAEKMMELLSDKKSYAKKIQEGHNHVQQYDWRIIAKQVEKTYVTVCDEWKKR